MDAPLSAPPHVAPLPSSGSEPPPFATQSSAEPLPPDSADDLGFETDLEFEPDVASAEAEPVRADEKSQPPPPPKSVPAPRPASIAPPPGAAQRPSTIPPPVPDEADAMHFEALRSAGICSDLTEGLLMVLQERVGSKDEDVRRLDLLEHYYDAGGDPVTADRRAEADRMLLFRSDNGASGRAVVSALAHTHPALHDTRLERLGGDDGPLVLRCGEHLSAIDDESAAGDATVSVRSLVAAFNVLLDRCDEPRRLVPLRGDGKREIYVALEIDAAISLCLADHLEEMTTNDLVAIACW